MQKVRITAVRRACHTDLMEIYENSLEDACSIQEGQVFVSVNCARPEGMCDSAWETLLPFVRILAEGGGCIYGDWMKDPHSAMISCNDGFRPVSFLLEAMSETAE